MFGGIKEIFAALSRLARSINTSADLFDKANEKLAVQLGVEEEERPALTNGTRRKVTKD